MSTNTSELEEIILQYLENGDFMAALDAIKRVHDFYI